MGKQIRALSFDSLYFKKVLTIFSRSSIHGVSTAVSTATPWKRGRVAEQASKTPTQAEPPARRQPQLSPWTLRFSHSTTWQQLPDKKKEKERKKRKICALLQRQIKSRFQWVYVDLKKAFHSHFQNRKLTVILFFGCLISDKFLIHTSDGLQSSGLFQDYYNY